MSRTQLANAIRFLAADAVQAAKSGHPGMPMGMADIAEVLWNDFHRHNPSNPQWVNRDRFVLSNGHGSMLQYALLHLSGYELSLDELRNFRQFGSQTPGHPEYGDTPGVETTTGPLGQGLANAVGLALGERLMAQAFNRPNFELINHRTWVFAGDGCLMEGVSHEAASLAGTLNLGKLVVFYDDNGISIDGRVDAWFGDDTAARFRAYNWQVLDGVDGHEPEQIQNAIIAALDNSKQPSLICCRTLIGKGAPDGFEDTAKAHGSPLGEEAIAATRQNLGWEHAPFEIPDEIYSKWNAHHKGNASEAEWRALWKGYVKAYPQEAKELERRINRELPEGFDALQLINNTQQQGEKIATRKASHVAINALAPLFPELLGGSADLTGSNLTHWGDEPGISEGGQRYLYYGVREFGMAAIMNGLVLYGGLRPFGGTFLVFQDYARNAIRMAALMRLPVIHIFTHDSIGLGEDGPTHQPIEQLTNLRTTPNLHCWRPADDVETMAAWCTALKRTDGPSALALSRQGLPHLQRSGDSLENILRGGYVLREAPGGTVHAVVIATGSEVPAALQALEQLGDTASSVRLVSMPCAEIFAAQDQAYQDSVLPPDIDKRIAVEAGHPDYWHKWTGRRGLIMGIDRFGASAPAEQLFSKFGLDADGIAARIADYLK